MHLLELGVLVASRHRRLRQDHAHQLVVELVLDADERGRDLNQECVIGRKFAGNDLIQAPGLAHDVGAQLAQPQNAQRVCDLAQQRRLRAELPRLPGATTHKDVEDVFDLGEVLANSGRHRLHELDGGGGEILALLLDVLVHRQKLGETKRGAHRDRSRTRGLGAAHVIEKIIEKLDRRGLCVARLALLVEAFDLAVCQSQQALDRDTALEGAFLQRLDDCADHPPQLEHRLMGRNLFNLAGYRRQDLEVLLDALAADPADEPDLETRAQPPPPLLDRQRQLTRPHGEGLRLLVGLQIQEQQSALGEERAAAHGAQIIQQRQQHERQIPAAGQHALEVAWQLHHRAHQRIQALGLALALRGGCEQIARDVLHFLGEQRRAVDLKYAQHALHLVQLTGAALEEREVERLLNVAFKRGARLGERRIQLPAYEIEGLRGNVRHGVRPKSRLPPAVGRGSVWPPPEFGSFRSWARAAQEPGRPAAESPRRNGAGPPRAPQAWRSRSRSRSSSLRSAR